MQAQHLGSVFCFLQIQLEHTSFVMRSSRASQKTLPPGGFKLYPSRAFCLHHLNGTSNLNVMMGVTTRATLLCQAWSGDGMYLATRNDNMPTAVWIWDMSRLELCATLLQIEHVRAVAWDPHHHRLAVVTGKGEGTPRPSTSHAHSRFSSRSFFLTFGRGFTHLHTHTHTHTHTHI